MLSAVLRSFLNTSSVIMNKMEEVKWVGNKRRDRGVPESATHFRPPFPAWSLPEVPRDRHPSWSIDDVCKMNGSSEMRTSMQRKFLGTPFRLEREPKLHGF